MSTFEWDESAGKPTQKQFNVYLDHYGFAKGIYYFWVDFAPFSIKHLLAKTIVVVIILLALRTYLLDVGIAYPFNYVVGLGVLVALIRLT